MYALRVGGQVLLLRVQVSEGVRDYEGLARLRLSLLLLLFTRPAVRAAVFAVYAYAHTHTYIHSYIYIYIYMGGSACVGWVGGR